MTSTNYVAKVRDFIRQLDQLIESQDWQGAYDVAVALWQYPTYQIEIANEQLRNDYIWALFKVADLFQYVGHSPYDALAPLKRIYMLDDGHLLENHDHSAKEIAAHKLGDLYEVAKCPHSAVEWFRRAYVLAQEIGVANNILRNLHRLAWNLETLRMYEEAGRYYDQMLEMLSGIPVQQKPYWFVPIAMYQIHHGDSAHGETLMRSLIAATLGRSILPRSDKEPLQVWFLAALRALAIHYITTERPQEAMELAQLIGKRAKRFDEPGWALDNMYGLTAQALLHMGRLDDALVKLSQIFDVEQPTFFGYDGPLETLELWGDIARIHAAHRHYVQSINAYEMLAYHLGGYIADQRVAQTTRLRFHWLQQQATVVHEMVSVWLTIPDEETRQRVGTTVANALLQLKANLFTAMEAHKLDILKYSTGAEFFLSNRRYAIAARKVLNDPSDQVAILEMEDALFYREKIERSLLTSDIISNPGVASVLHFDFRESKELDEETLLLDYSLINYRPPENGLMGAAQGSRYIGVRLAKGDLQVVDLGKAEPIEELCQAFIQTISKQPVASSQFNNEHQENRHFRLVESHAEEEIDLDQLARKIYDCIIAPFEPLTNSLLFSPDGLLAALPFHALVEGDRYLVEDRDIAYCHSLLQKESLSRRQLSPGRRAVPSITRSALLLGNPNYPIDKLPFLPGTELELKRVAELLQTIKFPEGPNVFEEVHVYTESQATVSKLLNVPWPRVLHIAAHGTFDESQTRVFADQPITSGRSYRRWEEMGALPLTALDQALLRSILILAEDPESVGDPAAGTILTALELASLNLIGCHVIVLSACETGAGTTEYGAGVLGFQYALLASFAKAGLVSLWKVLDQETASFMMDFYSSFLNNQEVKRGYWATVRAHCRRNNQRVHPYYWAAFILLDQEYYHPVF